MVFRETPCIICLVSHNGKILQNYGIISSLGYRHRYQSIIFTFPILLLLTCVIGCGKFYTVLLPV